MSELVVDDYILTTRIAAEINVVSVTTTQLLLAENPDRVMATVYNDSTAVMYLHYGEGCTSTRWSVQLAAANYYETIRGYTGVITVTWAAANGQARGVEFLRCH